MNTFDTFGTAINCIDGRVQSPVADWIKLHCHVQYVDMITHPGVDKILAEGISNSITSIADKIRISIEAHQTSIIAVIGHFDCAANNVSFDEHKVQIKQGVDLIKSWSLGVRVVGLYVNEGSSIDVVFDSDAEEFKDMNSFL